VIEALLEQLGRPGRAAYDERNRPGIEVVRQR
jgi:hypothetical protein